TGRNGNAKENPKIAVNWANQRAARFRRQSTPGLKTPGAAARRSRRPGQAERKRRRGGRWPATTEFGRRASETRISNRLARPVSAPETERARGGRAASSAGRALA